MLLVLMPGVNTATDCMWGKKLQLTAPKPQRGLKLTIHPCICTETFLCHQKRLATFMGQEESIIYAYDLSTIPSVLPAFANAKDLIIVDEVFPPPSFSVH